MKYQLMSRENIFMPSMLLLVLHFKGLVVGLSRSGRFRGASLLTFLTFLLFNLLTFFMMCADKVSNFFYSEEQKRAKKVKKSTKAEEKHLFDKGCPCPSPTVHPELLSFSFQTNHV